MRDIKIKSYQGVENAEIILHPGVNLFVGPSDTGKSSIVRALRDHSFNAVGEGFVTAGKKVASVEVDEVKWEKGKSVNRYIVGDKVYDKVGRGTVPDEVSDVTKIKEAEFGEGVSRQLNFCEQFSPEFMVADKASDNAKIIGSLSGINVVFNALREATADHNRARKGVEDSKRQVEKFEERVESLAYIGEVVEALDGIGVCIRKLDATERRKVRLLELASESDKLEVARAETLPKVERLRGLAAVDFGRYDSLRDRRGKLEGFRTQMDDIYGRRLDVKAKVEEDGRLAGVDFSALDGVVRLRSTLLGLAKRLVAVRGEKNEAGKKVVGDKEKHQMLLDSYDAAIDSMDVCPLSGKELPENCKQAISEQAK